jgi:uncharacterized membrane protein YdjX (TVP38/TMEM64 family)
MYSIININPDSLTNMFSEYKFLSIIIYLIIMILEVIIAPFHPLLFYIVGGIIFGPLLATILAILGGAIGGIIVFFIAKKWGRKWVEKKVPENKRARFDKFSEKYGGWAVFLLRLNPLTSTDLWNYVAGISKIGFWPYILGTTAGLIPATFIQIYLGVPIKNNPLFFKIFLIAIILYLIIGIALIFLLKNSPSQKNPKHVNQGLKQKHGLL